jgi:hypothetical protein
MQNRKNSLPSDSTEDPIIEDAKKGISLEDWKPFDSL